MQNTHFLKILLTALLCLSNFSYSENTFNTLIQQNKYYLHSPLRLHLGCGQRYFSEHINIDFPSTEHTVQDHSCADYFANITELQFPANTVDEVRSHHVFEHFTRQEALAMLAAWHTWLKVGGIIIIETPDFDASIKQLADPRYSYQEKQAIMRHVFGSHEAHWAIHCDGWYQEKYEHVLSVLGFEILDIKKEEYLVTRNIIVTARKAQNIDIHILASRAKSILRESLVCPQETEMFAIWTKDFDGALAKMIVS